MSIPCLYHFYSDQWKRLKVRCPLERGRTKLKDIFLREQAPAAAVGVVYVTGKASAEHCALARRSASSSASPAIQSGRKSRVSQPRQTITLSSRGDRNSIALNLHNLISDLTFVSESRSLSFSQSACLALRYTCNTLSFTGIATPGSRKSYTWRFSRVARG